MKLARWEPFDGLNRFQSRINELFDETFGRPRMAPTGTTGVWYPAVDILESKDSYLIRAELPWPITTKGTSGSGGAKRRSALG